MRRDRIAFTTLHRTPLGTIAALGFELEALDGPTLQSPGERWCQVRGDAQQYPSMQQVYDAVLSHLKPLDEILILGPGQAKRELRHRIEQQGA